jgi:hypothetical protein
MFNKVTFALLLTAGLLTSAFAAQDEREPPRTYSSERPIETDVAGLPLPRAVPGSLTLRPCSTCTPATLELTTAARFFVDRKPVSFAELRTLALKSSANVVVFYDTKTNAVTRIVVTDVR